MGAYLTGTRIYLRPLEREDLAGPMRQWANDPAVTQFTAMGVYPNTVEGLEYEYEQLAAERRSAGLTQGAAYPSMLVFAVVTCDGDKHVGNVGLYSINWIMRTAEVRVVIGEKELWGRGYASDAYRLLIGYAFDRLNLRRVYAGARADHAASIMALKKLGFVEEGRRREHFLRDDQPYDILDLGLLRREFIR
jgi:ribosomal-protein-alanine N-acetyltransferase